MTSKVMIGNSDKQEDVEEICGSESVSLVKPGRRRQTVHSHRVAKVAQWPYFDVGLTARQAVL